MLWDVDYTLVSAGGLGTRLYEVVFLEMFGRDLPAVAPKAGRTDRAIIADTLAMAGLDAPRDRVDAFLATLARQVAVADGMNVLVRALPGASGAIAALAASSGDGADSGDAAAGSGSGFRQSVLTGNIRPLAALKLRQAGLSDHLDLDVGAYGDVHEVRAELVPVARLAASQAYGADFGGWSTVLVGDTPLDVEAALAARARVVGVATGSYSQEELTAAGAHAVLPDLTDPARVRAAITGALPARRGQQARSPGPGIGRPATSAVPRSVDSSDGPAASGAAGRAGPGLAGPGLAGPGRHTGLVNNIGTSSILFE